jgi:hypothetical protein
MEGSVVEIILYSKPIRSNDGSSFSLAIDDQNLPANKKEEYLAQLKLILMEFKRYFYLEKYEQQLSKVTKLAEKNGTLASKLEGAPKEDLLEELQILSREVDRIKIKIIGLQQ